MKYPLTTAYGPAGWCVNDADGLFVARANTEAEANTIRDAMNKCEPPPDPATFPLAVIPPTDCWGWLSSAWGFFQSASTESAAQKCAQSSRTRPVRGRFIPDNATPEQVYAEVARLLNLLEPKVNAPSVKGIVHTAHIVLDYEADKDRVRIDWDAPTIAGLIESLAESAIEHCNEADHDWDSKERDHAADQDADARMRTRKAEDAD